MQKSELLALVLNGLQGVLCLKSNKHERKQLTFYANQAMGGLCRPWP